MNVLFLAQRFEKDTDRRAKS